MCYTLVRFYIISLFTCIMWPNCTNICLFWVFKGNVFTLSCLSVSVLILSCLSLSVWEISFQHLHSATVWTWRVPYSYRIFLKNFLFPYKPFPYPWRLDTHTHTHTHTHTRARARHCCSLLPRQLLPPPPPPPPLVGRLFILWNVNKFYFSCMYNCLPEDEPSSSKHVEDIKN